MLLTGPSDYVVLCVNCLWNKGGSHDSKIKRIYALFIFILWNDLKNIFIKNVANTSKEHPQQPLQILLFKIIKNTLLIILIAHLFKSHFSASLL
jgi:hypothetical protein